MLIIPELGKLWMPVTLSSFHIDVKSVWQHNDTSVKRFPSIASRYEWGFYYGISYTNVNGVFTISYTNSVTFKIPFDLFILMSLMFLESVFKWIRIPQLYIYIYIL